MLREAALCSRQSMISVSPAQVTPAQREKVPPGRLTVLVKSIHQQYFKEPQSAGSLAQLKCKSPHEVRAIPATSPYRLTSCGLSQWDCPTWDEGPGTGHSRDRLIITSTRLKSFCPVSRDFHAKSLPAKAASTSLSSPHTSVYAVPLKVSEQVLS